MALQPIRRGTTTQPNATQPAQAPTTPARPVARPTPSRPTPRPAAPPAQPARRGDFLRGVKPGAERHDPHFKAHGRYVAELEETDLFDKRDGGGKCFRAQFKVIQVLNEGSVKREGDHFNILFTTKNMDVYKGSMARLVIGLCKPTEEELAEDLEKPESEQTLMANLFDQLLDGDFNGYQYDIELTAAVSTKGADYTQIRYGDVVSQNIEL